MRTGEQPRPALIIFVMTIVFVFTPGVLGAAPPSWVEGPSAGQTPEEPADEPPAESDTPPDDSETPPEDSETPADDEAPEPADVPIGVWAGIGALVLIAVVWEVRRSYKKSTSDDDPSELRPSS